MDEQGNIIIYQSEDGVVRLDVRLEDKTVWLTIDQMSELFGKSRSTINEHILNIYEEGELEEEATKRKIGISDFSTKPTNFYNLDVIISVGYRVKSIQGTRFRRWATERLHEYIVKGFALDDEPFAQLSQMKPGELSAVIRERVIKARNIQTERFSSLPKQGGLGRVYCNAQMTERMLHEFAEPDAASLDMLRMAMERLKLSARAYSRILKVARTIADLAGSEKVETMHIAEAIGYRNLDRGDWAERGV